MWIDFTLRREISIGASRTVIRQQILALNIHFQS